VTEDVYVFVTSKSGELEQWVLFDDGTGLVDGSLVRRFDVGTQSEGCAADDEHGVLYVGEEDVGIWRYAAEPDAGESRQLVDQTGAGGHLSADVEGLTLYYASDGGGYLIASSQGDNSYVVYERDGSNDYVGTFEIAPGGGIDGTEITDGVDVTNADLGGAFPYGLFIAQDTYNPGGHQNFKLVPWDTIADAFPTPLTIDTGYR
jgi:3-phytase